MNWHSQPFRYGNHPRRGYVPGTRAKDLLTFIVAYQRDNGGISPSYPDMMSGCGFTSKAGVARAMDQLIADHKIRKLPHRARAIEVLTQVVGAAPQVIDRDRKPLVAPGPQAQFFVVEKAGDWEDARLVPMEGK